MCASNFVTIFGVRLMYWCVAIYWAALSGRLVPNIHPMFNFLLGSTGGYMSCNFEKDLCRWDIRSISSLKWIRTSQMNISMSEPLRGPGRDHSRNSASGTCSCPLTCSLQSSVQNVKIIMYQCHFFKLYDTNIWTCFYSQVIFYMLPDQLRLSKIGQLFKVLIWNPPIAHILAVQVFFLYFYGML